MADLSGESDVGQARLLQALAEQIKMPLMHIARRAELYRDQDETRQTLLQIEHTANLALRLIDNYLLSTRLSQMTLALEPVSLSAILHDTAEALRPIARQYNCELELSVAGKYGPVMAHRNGLQAALLSLGHVFIEAGRQPGVKKSRVTLAAHRTSGGIAAGVFSETAELTSATYQRARELYGRASQPLGELTAGSGAGVFVADSLLAAMAAPLRVASHQKISGLAATFIPSRQLSFV